MLTKKKSTENTREGNLCELVRYAKVKRMPYCVQIVVWMRAEIIEIIVFWGCFLKKPAERS